MCREPDTLVYTPASTRPQVFSRTITSNYIGLLESNSVLKIVGVTDTIQRGGDRRMKSENDLTV